MACLICLPRIFGQEYPFVPIANSPKNIERLLQDRQGRLWMSTHDDVLCFDGTRFFSLHEFGFPPVAAFGLDEDPEGGILVATHDGLFRFAKGRLEHVVSGVGLHEVLAVAPGLLLGAIEVNPAKPKLQLYRIRLTNGVSKGELLANWETGSALTRDHDGNVLIACPGGWCELSTKLIADWHPGYIGGPIVHKSELDILRVVRDRFGCLWFRSTEFASYQCASDEKPHRLPSVVAGRSVWAGEVENYDDGSMLFANVASLAIGRPGAFQVATPSSGLPPVAVTSAVRARDGSIWVGSIKGLYRFPYPFRLEHWASRHGLVWSLANDGHRIIAGTSTGVAFLNKQQEWTILSGSKEFGSIGSVLPDRQGNVYAAVSREGVVQLSADGNLVARTPVGQSARAETLARTADGQVWLAGGGIYRLRKRGASLSLDPEELPGDRSTAEVIALDKRTGDLWGCSAVGLMRRESGSWRSVTKAGDLPARSCVSLAFAGSDIWLGYDLDDVFARVHPGVVSRVTIWNSQSDPELGDSVGYFTGVDSRGWVWRGARDGIYVAESAHAEEGIWLHLNEADGLTELDANRRSFYSDSDGSVWWAAQSGIVHFSPPPDLVEPTAPPPVFLSSVSTNGRPWTLAEATHEFPHGTRLMIHIGSLQFWRPNAVRVRYRLLPDQSAWHESRVLDLDLGVPAWGTHTLEFQSRFSMGQWSETHSQLISMLGPWWFSLPAMLGFAV